MFYELGQTLFIKHILFEIHIKISGYFPFIVVVAATVAFFCIAVVLLAFRPVIVPPWTVLMAVAKMKTDGLNGVDRKNPFLKCFR